MKDTSLAKALSLDREGTEYLSNDQYQDANTGYLLAFEQYRLAITSDKTDESRFGFVGFCRALLVPGVNGIMNVSEKCGTIYDSLLTESLETWPSSKHLLFIQVYDDLYWGRIEPDEKELLKLTEGQPQDDITWFCLFCIAIWKSTGITPNYFSPVVEQIKRCLIRISRLFWNPRIEAFL